MTSPFHQSLLGYEYRAIVDDRPPLRRKQTPIAKTSGGWPALLRDIDALFLFGSGFGDVIRPVGNDDHLALCKKWCQMPQGKDYLGATVEILEDLYDIAGSKFDRKYLTSFGLQWHGRGAMLFEACREPGQPRCTCNRLQDIISSKAIGRVTYPGPLPSQGAVIFGKSQITSETRSPIINTSGMYSMPNVDILASRSSTFGRSKHDFPHLDFPKP